MSKITRHFLVDIDMLFDFRFTIYNEFDPKGSLEDVAMGNWHDRDRDTDWRNKINQSKSQYFELLERSGINIMKNSLGTYLINNIIPETNIVLEDSPGQSIQKNLTINFPYQVPDQDTLHELRGAMYTLFDGYFDKIYFCAMKHAELGLQTMRRRGWTDYFCYEWQRWMEVQYKSFENELSPNFRVWFPILLSDQIDNKQMKVDPKKRKAILAGRNVFELVGFIHSPAFETHWLEVYQCCFYTPKIINDTSKETS